MSMSNTDADLPETITYGKGMTMTFLRNQAYITKNQVSGDPDADVLYVPPHWHETHDEIIRVVEGRMEIMLGASVREYTPEDGDVRIPKGVVHSLRTSEGVKCTFYERTDPMDDQKEIFFRNLLGKGAMSTNLFDAMLIFYHGDAVPAFPVHFARIEKFFVTLVGGYIAPLLGYRRKYESLKKAD
ncbi:hypothetical protein LshimejAT787_0703250 [Lyophyllum shimeji]|uniref:Cupin type-2 domain-containing protein n=1 Tax=Lyophyllum shimeji TaxID=47721 RepID=A0A9P3PPS9_LYOSH|nr:hypothetical protein LshimejAT787_0703250 [Lyophyllum shimeji]